MLYYLCLSYHTSSHQVIMCVYTSCGRWLEYVYIGTPRTIVKSSIQVQPSTTAILIIQWNLRNKTTIWAMKSGLIFEVVLIPRTIIHVCMDLRLNQSGLISKVVVL